MEITIRDSSRESRICPRNLQEYDNIIAKLHLALKEAILMGDIRGYSVDERTEYHPIYVVDGDFIPSDQGQEILWGG